VIQSCEDLILESIIDYCVLLLYGFCGMMKQKIAWLGANNVDCHVELVKVHGHLKYSLVQIVVH
jgi:hypothetical protein